MHNLILAKEAKELLELSKKLGFTKTMFLEKDFVIVKAKSKKELLKEIGRAKGKLTIYKTESEELLRFALEKTKIDLIYGMETINPRDSVHFVRGGLDQITCRIAAEKDKIIAFRVLYCIMRQVAVTKKTAVQCTNKIFIKDKFLCSNST